MIPLRGFVSVKSEWFAAVMIIAPLSRCNVLRVAAFLDKNAAQIRHPKIGHSSRSGVSLGTHDVSARVIKLKADKTSLLPETLSLL